MYSFFVMQINICKFVKYISIFFNGLGYEVLDMCFVQKKLHETYFKMICNVHKKKMN